MQKISKIILPVTVISIATIGIMVTTLQNPSYISENQLRTQPTTKTAPKEEFSTVDSLHKIFEEETGFCLESIEKNKKITKYIYDASENLNQQNIFLEFGKALKNNGYEQIYNQIDATGYFDQYEVLYNDLHFMVYIESSSDNITLSIIDYNEDEEI